MPREELGGEKNRELYLWLTWYRPFMLCFIDEIHTDWYSFQVVIKLSRNGVHRQIFPSNLDKEKLILHIYKGRIKKFIFMEFSMEEYPPPPYPFF